MNLIIYTNLQSFVSSGLFGKFGLSEQQTSLRPIKGIGPNGVHDHLRNSNEASKYKIIFCCEDAVSTKQLIELLDPQKDYALALHASNSAKLFDLYCSFVGKCEGKLLYRFESSEDSQTITFLQNLLEQGHQAELYRTFFQAFEEEARFAYKKSILASLYHPFLSPLLTSFSQKKPNSYLWREMVREYEDLEMLIESYIQSSSILQKKSILKLIEQHFQF